MAVSDNVHSTLEKVNRKMSPQPVSMTSLKAGEHAVVLSFEGGRAVRNRLASALGFTPGAEVDMTQNYRSGPSRIRHRARGAGGAGTRRGRSHPGSAEGRMNECHDAAIPLAQAAVGAPLIALAGQPNMGKSTLFNLLTGLNQHVGNWTGKTVERREKARSATTGASSAWWICPARTP